MAGGTLGRSHRPMADINVTPLVDVMLVLLIIFMVTAPMMQQGIDVDLPNTTTQNIRVDDPPLVLTIKKDGTMHLAESQQSFSVDELKEKLTAILDGAPGQEVFLRADEKVPYGVVAKALAAAREAGVEKLGMVTEPE